MALTGEQWLDREFRPVVASMSPAGKESAESSRVLQAILGLRLLGALDALSAVGVLSEDQQAQCRSDLEGKGLTETRSHVTMTSMAWASAIVTGRSEAEDPATPQVERDQLREVVAVNKVLGLIEDEPCLLVSLELWSRSVRAHLLLDVSEHTKAQQTAVLEMGRWARDRANGDEHEADRPAHLAHMGYPGGGVTWELEVNDLVSVGSLVSGHGGGDQYRLEISWDAVVPDDCEEIVVQARDGEQITGRVTIPL